MVPVNTEILKELLEERLNTSEIQWLNQCVEQISSDRDTRQLYLTYSLLANKVDAKDLALRKTEDPIQNYLYHQEANCMELSRIYLLAEVLDYDFDIFAPKVAQIIQVADQTEMVTFLKFLILLPKAEYFKTAAVESLRTNITPVFEAIAMNNPYPARYFNEQQWNQMYLKAAFMQLDLANIVDVEKRANNELARIISDYAHERWAASRDIDPMIWRPVSAYMNSSLLKDMERLLNSENPVENRAGALCCYHSENAKAQELLRAYSELQTAIEEHGLDWNNIKD